MTTDTARDREMILNPDRWPHLILPLTRNGADYPGESDVAVVLIPPHVLGISEETPIKVALCNMFLLGKDSPTKRYANVDALLADGWRVD